MHIWIKGTYDIRLRFSILVDPEPTSLTILFNYDYGLVDMENYIKVL